MEAFEGDSWSGTACHYQVIRHVLLRFWRILKQNETNGNRSKKLLQELHQREGQEEQCIIKQVEI